jgi:hypothetical protein
MCVAEAELRVYRRLHAHGVTEGRPLGAQAMEVTSLTPGSHLLATWIRAHRREVDGSGPLAAAVAELKRGPKVIVAQRYAQARGRPTGRAHLSAPSICPGPHGCEAKWAGIGAASPGAVLSFSI